MGAFFHVLYVVIVQDLLGPFYLSVSDVTLVFHHFLEKVTMILCFKSPFALTIFVFPFL